MSEKETYLFIGGESDRMEYFVPSSKGVPLSAVEFPLLAEVSNVESAHDVETFDQKWTHYRRESLSVNSKKLYFYLEKSISLEEGVELLLKGKQE